MKILAPLLIALSSLLPLPTHASTEMEQHKELMRSLHHVGVSIVINDSRYCDAETSGSYFPNVRLLSVCQDGATSFNGKMIPWTDNDLDTLRHEAQHVVQDCNEGVLGDGELGAMFDTKKLFELMKNSNIPMSRYKALAADYLEGGAPPTHVIMEMEAFMVASDIPANYIASKVVEFCEY